MIKIMNNNLLPATGISQLTIEEYRKLQSIKDKAPI